MLVRVSVCLSMCPTCYNCTKALNFKVFRLKDFCRTSEGLLRDFGGSPNINVILNLNLNDATRVLVRKLAVKKKLIRCIFNNLTDIPANDSWLLSRNKISNFKDEMRNCSKLYLEKKFKKSSLRITLLTP